MDDERKITPGSLTRSAIALAAIGLIATTVYASAKNEDSEAERVRVKKALAQARAERPSLMDRMWPEGNAAMLQKMTAEDIARMQIFGVTWEGSIDERRKEQLSKRYYMEPPFGTEGKEEVEALLTLCKRAKKFRPRRMQGPLIPNRVLVVQPVKGEPFEIMHNSGLHAPFGGLESLELKEALFALGGGRTRITIIDFHESKVQRVIHHSAIAPHTGGVSSQTVRGEMHLTSEQGLTLYLKVRDGANTLMEDEKRMHYGEAKVFAGEGPGSWVVLLHKP